MSRCRLFLTLAVLAVMGGLLTACSSDDTTSPSRGVYSAGDATILGTFLFDFDRGGGGNVAMPTGFVSDAWWNRLTATASQLESQHGAKFVSLGVVTFDDVTWDQVTAAALTTSPISGTVLTVGTVVAYMTDAGRYGKFTITGYAGNQDMSISWLTWE